MASGAEGLAGLSAVSGDGGAVAQPASRPKATNGIEHGFMIRCGGEFPETAWDIYSAEIPGVLLDLLVERYRSRSRCRGLPQPGSMPPKEKQFSAI